MRRRFKRCGSPRLHRGTLANIFLTVLMLMVASGGRAERKNVRVGEIGSYTTFVPVCATWHDTWTETVYTADLFGGVPEDAKICSMSYLGIAGADIPGMTYEIYVKPTQATTAPADHSDLSDFTCVYSGPASIAESEDKGAAATLLEVELAEPFVYEGGNLHVVVKSHIDELPAASVNFAYQTVARSSLLTLSNNDWASYNKYTYNNLPVMELGIEMPEGYVELESVTVGSHGQYAEYERLPLDFAAFNTLSASIYTSDILGIPSGKDIHRISFYGSVYSTSSLPHTIKVYLGETADTTLPVAAPDTDRLTLVAERELTLDTRVGTFSNWAEILKIPFDTPYRYKGGNLMLVVEADNSAAQQVYFCQNPGYDGSTVYGTGDSPGTMEYYPGSLPTTNFYYAAPQADEGRTPAITLTTRRETGKKLGVFLASTSGVEIEWGGGYVMEYPYSGYLTLTHDLYGQEIRIYPLGDAGEITDFYCNNGELTSVTLDAPGLKMLQLRDNLLDGIDISGCPLLEGLDLTGNRIFEFAASSDRLRILRLAKCGLEQLIITECTGLQELDVSVNSLRYPIWLFWPEAPGLKTLNVSFNQLLGFDLTGYPALETLICNHNIIPGLMLRDVPKLRTLRAGYNPITTLDIARCPDLKVLDICGTEAGGISLASNPGLEELNLQLTGISEVDLSANRALRHVNLSQNSLTAVSLAANTALEHLDLSRNSIDALDLGALSKLAYLDCSRNSLTDIDLSRNAALDTLYCSVNRLTSLPLPASNHIRHLDFSSNSITRQPDGMSKVVYLNCSDNGWTSADFTKTPDLLGLDIHSNALDKDALTAVFRQLPDINGVEIPEDDAGWMTVLDYSGNPGAGEVTPDIPETKGWNCSYTPDILGDASAAIRIPSSLIYSRISIGLDTTDEVYYVDWGDGRKEEFRTEDPEYSYNSIVGYALGDVVRIYAPGATELGACNAGYPAIDVSGMPGLLRLSVSGNALTSIDLSANPKINDLNCGENPLTALTLPEECALQKLDCSSTLLRGLDLSLTPGLTYLAVNSCRLEDLDVTPAPGLTDLRADNNALTSIDLSRSPRLQNLILSRNSLQSLDLSAQTGLLELSADYNSLTELDLSPAEFLQSAYVNNNALSSLTLGNIGLKVLLASSNSLESIDLSEERSLTVVSLYDNMLSTLDLSENTALQQIFAGANRLTDIRMPRTMAPLRVVNVSSNRLSSINTAAATGLTELVISYNDFSGTLDLSANPAITYLDMAHNAITSVKWGNQCSLATLYASYNALQTLNVPSDDLSVIDCSRNALEAVNVSRNTNLFYLVLDFNRLSSLNLASNQKLWGVSLRANELQASAIDRICEQLPNIQDVGVVPGEEAWMKYLFLSGNPGCAEANTRPAHVKGWTVVTDEEIPVDRVLTIEVADEDGAPVTGATLTLIVDGEAVGTRAVETSSGTYVYDPLPVFSGLSYGVRVAKTGYVTATVAVEGIYTADRILSVVLLKGSGVTETEAPLYSVRGGVGCIGLDLPEATAVSVHDISGRLVYSAVLPAGSHTVGGLAPGVYIAAGHKVLVR